jgi:GNAT superfamily N-acetyltransferase
MPADYLSDATIRPATAKDEAALTALAVRLGECPLPSWRSPDEIATADLRAMVNAVRAGDSNNEVFVAERAAAVVGCLHVLTETDFFGKRHSHLSVLSVAASEEGTGLATRLIAHAEDWTRARGLHMITLNVIDGNARARRLYERRGFKPEIVRYVKPL